jgi:hypothetical protein
MLVRIAFLALIMASALAQTGCCGTPWGGCWPCGKNWCESSCGEVFWSEWFSIPPECCDQCDDCGYFTGKKRPDNLYSHGNDYHGWCEKRQAHGMHYTDYAEPIPAGRVSEPTPAPAPSQGEPYSPSEAAPEPMPGPVEDMPTTRRMPRDKYGRPISYNQAAPRGQQRLIEQASRAWYADEAGEVDSRPPTRTLAKPPRTRLFSR